MTSTPTVAPSRERALAWAMDAVACVYIVWMFSVNWRSGDTFKQMFEGLGMELPLATRVLITHGFWLSPTLALLFCGVIVGKELFTDDKRFSVMITFFVALVAQTVSQTIVTAYYLPLFDMLRKLG